MSVAGSSQRTIADLRATSVPLYLVLLFLLLHLLACNLLIASSCATSWYAIGGRCVNFDPDADIDLAPYLSDFATARHSPDYGSSTSYRLYAVSNHMGSLGGGHYTAYAKVDEQWCEPDRYASLRPNLAPSQCYPNVCSARAPTDGLTAMWVAHSSAGTALTTHACHQ